MRFSPPIPFNQTRRIARIEAAMVFDHPATRRVTITITHKRSPSLWARLRDVLMSRYSSSRALLTLAGE